MNQVMLNASVVMVCGAVLLGFFAYRTGKHRGRDDHQYKCRVEGCPSKESL